MSNPNFPTGTRGVVAVDRVGNQILFLNPQTLEIESVLDGFAPNVHELGISPDGSTAYAPIYGDGRHATTHTPGTALPWSIWNDASGWTI